MPEADPSTGSAEFTPPTSTSAGPVTVQVTPQGHVTITVVPSQAMPDLGGLETFTPESFSLVGGPRTDETAVSPFKQVADKLKSALETLGESLRRRGYRVSPGPLVVTNGRVRAGYQIGELLFGTASDAGAFQERQETPPVWI